jgi:hypothetical protein
MSTTQSQQELRNSSCKLAGPYQVHVWVLVVVAHLKTRPGYDSQTPQELNTPSVTGTALFCVSDAGAAGHARTYVLAVAALIGDDQSRWVQSI